MIPSIKCKVFWSYGQDLSDPSNSYQIYSHMKCVIIHYITFLVLTILYTYLGSSFIFLCFTCSGCCQVTGVLSVFPITKLFQR